MARGVRDLKGARRKAEKLHFNDAAYTLVICMDRKTSKCCTAETMDRVWKLVKRKAKELEKETGRVALRIKSGCLGICRGGPLIGVFPDGVWYGGCDPVLIERIFEEHLRKGEWIQDSIIAQPCSSSSPSVDHRTLAE